MGKKKWSWFDRDSVAYATHLSTSYTSIYHLSTPNTNTLPNLPSEYNLLQLKMQSIYNANPTKVVVGMVGRTVMSNNSASPREVLH